MSRGYFLKQNRHQCACIYRQHRLLSPTLEYKSHGVQIRDNHIWADGTQRIQIGKSIELYSHDMLIKLRLQSEILHDSRLNK